MACKTVLTRLNLQVLFLLMVHSKLGMQATGGPLNHCAELESPVKQSLQKVHPAFHEKSNDHIKNEKYNDMAACKIKV